MHHTITVFFITDDKKENKVATVGVIKYIHLVERNRYLSSNCRVKFEKTFSKFHDSQKVRFGK